MKEESRVKGKGKRDLKQEQMIHYKANLRKTKGGDNIGLTIVKTKICKTKSGKDENNDILLNIENI
ncbi:1987_t:CDS:2 [Acaulospora morrowiae]|uniref:1987_t:CDS:1 n=1 Tax=Acaulospora morrowiae TaxID=94023 RepID=A0A9N8ZYZ7_9GLOM|nr:1987_t:CDS:2 [Acaulospora morrowiae]